MKALAGVHLAAALALALPQIASAQGTGKTKPPAAAPAPDVAPTPPPEPPPPPYEPQLMRLAEIMGALAFLRDLCGEADGVDWHLKMKALLETEAKTDTRRERLAGAYNRGFRGYEVIYRACTPAAQAVIGRFLDEGGRLAHEITNRFSG